MTLYEINARLQQIYDDAIDPETGEISEEALGAIEDLELSRNEKIDNTACYIKSLIAEATSIKAEMDNLQKRKQRAEKSADYLKRYLEHELAGEKFSSPRCVISYRKTQKVILDDLNAVPKDYIRHVETFELDKESAKKAIKAGVNVGGCHLEENISMSIK